MKYAIHSSNIYTEQGIYNGYLVVENDTIIDLVKDRPTDINIEEFGAMTVAPGIIDIHNHGFYGWSMTDECTVRDIEGYAKSLTTVGVTGVLPTAKESAFEAVNEYMKDNSKGSKVYGIHSEGPFWARGGENTIGESWPTPSVEETQRLIDLAKGSLKMMAIAPELPNAYDVINLLQNNHIKVACCHTKSNSQQIEEALNSVKIDIATHLGNGMQGIHHRNVGTLGALLLNDHIMYEVITDLNHICKEMLEIMFKLQPYDKFCLISDSNFMAGLPSGKYNRYGRVMIADDKGLILNSDGRICGSGKWVLHNMRQLAEIVKVPKDKIIQMASLNPAKFLGIDSFTGSIAVGKKADIIVFNDEYQCLATFVHGSKLYDNSMDSKSFENPEAMSRKVD